MLSTALTAHPPLGVRATELDPRTKRVSLSARCWGCCSQRRTRRSSIGSMLTIRSARVDAVILGARGLDQTGGEMKLIATDAYYFASISLHEFATAWKTRNDLTAVPFGITMSAKVTRSESRICYRWKL